MHPVADRPLVTGDRGAYARTAVTGDRALPGGSEPAATADSAKSSACAAARCVVGAHATLIERIAGQGERVHIPLGAECNNNCLFCMEEDRDGRRESILAMDSDRVRWILEQHRGAHEVCFTSGEPTLRTDLPKLASWALELGYARISLMTNGRRLGYGAFTAALVRAGIRRFYVSIHGDTRALHDGLTRTPGSFAQTMTGIMAVARLKPAGVELNTSTVLTKRNAGRQTEIYELLRSRGVDQIVFNALQMNGRAETFFDPIVPRYADVRAGFERLMQTSCDAGRHAFLVDVPMCISEGLPDANRGWVERHLHYETDARPGPLRAVSTRELDQDTRKFGKPCEGCKVRALCPGVYENYLQRFGWDEFGLAPETSSGPR